MKKYISLLAVPALALLMGACSKETEDQTWIVTYGPDIEIIGETYQCWKAGVPYTDPGVNVTLDGKPLSDPVTVSTSMNFEDPKPGFYSIVYSLTTPDGKVAQGSRNVAVYSDLYPAQGWYKTNMAESNRAGTTFLNRLGDLDCYVKVSARFDGDYNVEDLLGGFYNIGFAYGGNYCLSGVIHIDSSNVVSLLSSYCSGWKDAAEGFEDGSFDPATSTLLWSVEYTSVSPFNVTMTKVN